MVDSPPESILNETVGDLLTKEMEDLTRFLFNDNEFEGIDTVKLSRRT